MEAMQIVEPLMAPRPIHYLIPGVRTRDIPDIQADLEIEDKQSLMPISPTVSRKWPLTITHLNPNTAIHSSSSEALYHGTGKSCVLLRNFACNVLTPPIQSLDAYHHFRHVDRKYILPIDTGEWVGLRNRDASPNCY